MVAESAAGGGARAATSGTAGSVAAGDAQAASGAPDGGQAAGPGGGAAAGSEQAACGAAGDQAAAIDATADDSTCEAANRSSEPEIAPTPPAGDSTQTPALAPSSVFSSGRAGAQTTTTAPPSTSGGDTAAGSEPAADSPQTAGMDVMEAIMRRRAIRRFSARQLREEDLQQILTSGLYAPSAGGRQGVIFAVSQDPRVNEQLGRIKRANSNPHMAHDGVYVSREQPSIADDPDIRDAFYGAPCVITLFAPRGFAFSVDDCAVAAENMMLAATALGVGSCYIGQGWTAFADPYGQDVLREWDIPNGYYAVLQLLLGYPREGDTHPNAKPRKAARVLRF